MKHKNGAAYAPRSLMVSLESFLPAHRFSGFRSDAEKNRMTAINNIIRGPDGRFLFRCGTPPPPTNPKAGPPASGNTVIWNERTRVSSLVIPRQNSVNLDTWAPQSHLRTYSGPVTYAKPPFRQAVTDTIAATRKSSVNDPCVARLASQMQCIAGRLVRR